MNQTQNERQPRYHMVGMVQHTTDGSIQVGNQWFNLSRRQKEAGYDLPGYGESVNVTYYSFQGRNYIDNWERNMSTAPQAPHQNDAQGFHDDKPVVTRLACLNAAIATWGNNTIDEAAILGLAERYVAWVLYGGIDKRGKQEPAVSEVLWNPEYNPYE